MSGYHPIVTRAAMTMVLADPTVDRAGLQLAGMVGRLADTIRTELDDLTWVLHVVWDSAALPPPTSPPTLIRVPPAANVTLFVHNALNDFCDLWGIAFDQVLIEASQLDPDGLRNDELWWAMDGLSCPASVDYLFDDPEVWDNLPVTLGLMPAIAAQPVVLLGPLPETRIVQNLLIEFSTIVTSSNPIQKFGQFVSDGITTGRFADWLRRWIAVVTQIYGYSALMPASWPLDAVRLRLDETNPLATPDDDNDASYERWARGVTRRRVGIALGGAGAQSYVGIPFIEQLEDEGVPLDMISGTSTGTFVGAMYAALGDRGLLRMLLNSNTIGWGVFFAFFNNYPLTWWLAWATEFLDLSELAQPTISVSTTAAEGDAFHQTAGLAGKGMMASGSLPPFVSTWIGNTRLLDGGLSQDVPTAVLSTAGASLVIASQAIPKVEPIPQVPSFLPLPFWVKESTILNPLVRGWDYYRGYIMLFRQAAHAQEQYAQVFYNATTRFSSAGSWYAGPRIAAEAANSQALQDAVAEAKLYWQALLDDAPGRVRVNLATGEVEVGPAVDIGFEHDPTGSWRLTPDAELVLGDVGRFIVGGGASGLEVRLIDPDPPADIPTFESLIRTASGLAPALVTFLPPSSTIPLDPTFVVRVV